MKRRFFQELLNKFFNIIVGGINFLAFKFPLNRICGTCAGFLTLQQGTLPALWAIKPLDGLIISILTHWFLGRSFSYAAFVKYLPTICGGIFFYLRNNTHSSKLFYCFQVLILTVCMYLFSIGFSTKVPYLYASIWLILFIPFDWLSLWFQSFQAVCVSHMIGALLYHYSKVHLVYDDYNQLFFISLIERIILATVFYFSFKLYQYIYFDNKKTIMKSYLFFSNKNE